VTQTGVVAPPPTYSTARLDSLVCPVFVDSSQLQSCLPAHARLSLPPLPHVPEGRHPVIIEIWRVQDGLIEVAGLTAHRMWELAGGAAGLGLGGTAGAALGAGIGAAAGAASGGALGMWFGPLAWWWGTAAGAATGVTVGATMLAPAGAVRGARWGIAAGRRTSETNSRTIGTYNEIIVTVPCRLAGRGVRAGDFAYVLATYTDSSASMLGESVVGWGYRKSQAFGTRRNDGALEVRAESSDMPLMRLRDVGSQPTPSIRARSTATHVLASLSRPLLGTHGERLMVSCLDRSFDGPRVRVTPVSARLESSDAFLPGVRGFVSDIRATGDDAPWGAFSVKELPVRLSYPRAVAD
jgi:hypothetical protein